MPTEELFGNYNIKADPVGSNRPGGFKPADIAPRLKLGGVSGFEATPIDRIVNNVLAKLDVFAETLDADEQTVLATLLGATDNDALSEGWPGTATFLDDE